MSEELTLGERELLKDTLIGIGNRLENATIPYVEAYPANATADSIIDELCKKNQTLREVIVRITLSNNNVVVLQNRCIASCRANKYMGTSLTFNDTCMLYIRTFTKSGFEQVIIPLSHVFMVEVEEQSIDVLRMVNTSKPEENDNFRERINEALRRRAAHEELLNAGFAKLKE